MRGEPGAGSRGKSGAGASILALLVAASCATGSPAGVDRVTEDLSTLVGSGSAPAAASTQPLAPGTQAAVAADQPLLSDARRADPLRQSLLVLGLPLPELRLPAPSAELTAPLRQAPTPAPALASLSPIPLGDPALPPRLASAKPAKAPQSGSGREGSLQAPAPGPSAPKSAPRPTPAPAAAAAGPAKTGSSGAAEPPAHPAPAAPQASPALSPSPAPATAETIPSIPPSLRPLVDLSATPTEPTPRSFSVELGSRISIPFVGTGWTYLGERDGKEGVLYDSRRFEGQGALFTLLGSRQGSYRLRFLHQDLERGTTNEELVSLEVLPKGSLVSQSAGGLGGVATGDSAGPTTAGSALAVIGATGGSAAAGGAPTAGSAAGAMTAGPGPASVPASAGSGPAAGAGAASGSAAGGSSPAAATAMPSQGNQGAPGAAATSMAGAAAVPAAGTAQPAASSPLSQPATAAAPAPAPGIPEAYLATARAEYAAGRAPTTIAAAEAYLALNPAGPGADEALWLEAQALELNSPARDVAKALGLYRRLTEGWPRSPFWAKADARASYIQRYYFDIR